MKIEIFPFTSVGGIEFGATEQAILTQLGLPSRSVESKPLDSLRLDYKNHGLDYDISKDDGLVLVVVTKADHPVVLFGENAFSSDIIATLTRRGFKFEVRSDSFGVTAHCAIELGLEFCFEENELGSIHCYERRAWADYMKELEAK